jgi:hypothetical protein
VGVLCRRFLSDLNALPSYVTDTSRQQTVTIAIVKFLFVVCYFTDAVSIENSVVDGINNEGGEEEYELAGETEILGENPPHYQFLHHRYNMTRPVIKPRPPRWGP